MKACFLDRSSTRTMIHPCTMAFFLLITMYPGKALGETTSVFQTSFNQLPEDWTGTEWGFGSGGAHLYEWVGSLETFEAVMQSVPLAKYFVPDGADSLVVDMEHSITVAGSDGYVTVSLHTSTMQSHCIFEAGVTQFGFVSSEPVHFVITEPPQGTYVGFSFDVFVSASYPESGVIDWHVTGLSAVAYGDGMPLEPVSWGTTKRRFI